MTTLGNQWRQQVPTDAANRRILEDSLVQREQHAQAWVKQAQLTDLPNGIASCISRNSDSLALPLPSQHVTTQAFRNYLTSLNAQDLTVDVSFDADGEGQSLLLVTPATR